MSVVSYLISSAPLLSSLWMGACSSSGSSGETASGSGGSGSVASFDYERQLSSSSFGPYSVVVKSEQRAGETGIHRSPATANGELCTVVYPNEAQPVTTIWNGFERGVRVSSREPCLGTRLYLLDGTSGRYKVSDGMPERGGYVWTSYAEVDAEAKEIGAGLVALGLTPSESSVGIYGKNRHEWVTGALGLWSQSMRCVALYDTFGPDSIQFIIGQADLTVLLVSRENLPVIAKVAPHCPRLTHVVQFDERQQWQNVEESLSPADVDAFAALNIRLLGFSALRSLGQSSTTIFPTVPSPSTIAYIMYTSGTTGNPKVRTHTHIYTHTHHCIPSTWKIPVQSRANRRAVVDVYRAPSSVMLASARQRLPLATLCRSSLTTCTCRTCRWLTSSSAASCPSYCSQAVGWASRRVRSRR